MANEGGHGGSSHYEITTPVLFISNKNQLDLSYRYLNNFELNDLIDQIKTYEQIDLVSTLSCLFDLEIPIHNKGFTFINQLVNSLGLIKNIENQKNVFKCLIKNIEQLDNLDRILDERELKDNVERLKTNFIREMNSNLEENIKHNKLVEINTEIEMSIRAKMNENLKNDYKNQQQNYYLILSIVISLIVIIHFSLFVFILN
jgi:hypothetical protein